MKSLDLAQLVHVAGGQPEPSPWIVLPLSSLGYFPAATRLDPDPQPWLKSTSSLGHV
jgi:hypothetical protein